MDKNTEISDLSFTSPPRKVELARGGPFRFQIGVDSKAIETAYLRVCDAQQRFASFPLHMVSERLELEVIATSIYSTNTIEGGALDYEQTQIAMNLSAGEIKEVEEQRVTNLRDAYELAKAAGADEGWVLDVAWIKRVHAAVTSQLPHEYDQPGIVRDNPKHRTTTVGSENHGGVYKPPQYHGDIELLLQELVAWHQELKDGGVPALIRAPLIHLYYELIHPFYDGNGRVGRVIEASILINDGFRYAPFGMAAHYHQNIHEYFAMFNVCRKQASKKEGGCNTPFVLFFLEGMLSALNKLHDRCNIITTLLMYEFKVKQLHDTKQLNNRQYAIIQQVAYNPSPIRTKELRNHSWYTELYRQRTPKTAKRDLDKLLTENLLKDVNGELQLEV